MQDTLPPPCPVSKLCPPMPSSREGPGSRLLIGACDQSLSCPPGKLRSGAWPRGRAGSRAQSCPPSHLSWSPSCLSSFLAPLCAPNLFSPVSGCRPQLFLFPNCTVWPVRPINRGPRPDRIRSQFPAESSFAECVWGPCGQAAGDERELPPPALSPKLHTGARHVRPSTPAPLAGRGHPI